MKQAFVDSAYWIALLNPRDQMRGAVFSILRQAQQRSLVTSELVIIEVLDHLAKSTPGLRQTVGNWARAAMLERQIRVIPHSSLLLHEALNLYLARLDKHWSLTDCASIVIMHQLGIDEVLTSDHHFEQAGFTLLTH